MLKGQDIEVPYGDDGPRVEWSIDDGGGDTPTNLVGLDVRWVLYRDSRQDVPLLSFDSSTDAKLTIDDAEGGVVSLHLGEEETTAVQREGRYYLRVIDSDGEGDESIWTVATGDFTPLR